MAGLPILAATAFTEGLDLEFIDTYRQRRLGPESALARSMEMDIPSNKRTEDYFYWENAPLIRRWLAGTKPNFGTFKGVSYSVENLDWKEGVTWLRKDRRDDLTRQMVTQARSMAISAALLDEDVFYQVNAASVDARLLEVIPLAPDGVSLHNAVDGGGNDRFGVSGGNIETGVGVADAATIRTGFFSAVSRARQFENTKGQQLLASNSLESITVYAPAIHEQVFREAFQQVRVQGTGAAPTNIVQDAGFNVNLVLTPKLTGTTWFMYFDNVEPKPIFSQLREAVRSIMVNEDNSQESAENGIESLMEEMSKGFGVNVPFGTIQLTA